MGTALTVLLYAAAIAIGAPLLVWLIIAIVGLVFVLKK